MLRIVKIAVLTFATYAQDLLIAYLAKVDPAAAEWFSENWSGARGRYCLCHAGYGGSNSNMGVEVDWRDMKKLCPPSSTLSTFLAHMLSFIRNLGEEHAQFLEDQGTPGAFISTPVATKSMWDMVQDFHPKTLACCFIVVGKGSDLGKAYDDINLDIIGCGSDDLALHLKIEAWHEQITAADKTPAFRIGLIRTILMPRQPILKRLDPNNTRSVHDVREDLRIFACKYMSVVMNNKKKASHTIDGVMEIYEMFHLLSRAAKWSPVPMNCTCCCCNKNCLCGHLLLFGSIFDKTLKVPPEYITSVPSERKKTRMLKGTAGPKRARIRLAIAEERAQAAEKAARLVSQHTLHPPARSTEDDAVCH